MAGTRDNYRVSLLGRFTRFVCRVIQELIYLIPRLTSIIEFASSRLAIFGGQLSEKNDEIVISPTDPNIRLQRASVYFPPQLTDSTWDVTPPKFSVALVVLRYELETLFEKSVPREVGFLKFVPEFGVPLIIDSVYTAKGQVFEDRSLYLLTSFVTVFEEDSKRPTIQFQGLRFLERIGRDKTPHETLRGLWNQVSITPAKKK